MTIDHYIGVSSDRAVYIITTSPLIIRLR